MRQFCGINYAREFPEKYFLGSYVTSTIIPVATQRRSCSLNLDGLMHLPVFLVFHEESFFCDFTVRTLIFTQFLEDTHTVVQYEFPCSSYALFNNRVITQETFSGQPGFYYPRCLIKRENIIFPYPWTQAITLCGGITESQMGPYRLPCRI